MATHEMAQKSRGGAGAVAILLGLGIGALVLFGGGGSAGAATPVTPDEDKCKKLIADFATKAGHTIDVATKSDIPALNDLRTVAVSLGCTDLVTQIDAKIKEVTPTTGGGGGSVPKTQVVTLTASGGTLSGPNPMDFAASFGMTLSQMVAMNPSLIVGNTEAVSGTRFADCGIAEAVGLSDLPTSTTLEAAQKVAKIAKTKLWLSNGQVDDATNRPVFANEAASGEGFGHRVSDGAGGIDCSNHGVGVGRIFSGSRFIKPWKAGQKVTVFKSAGVAGEATPLCASCSGEASISGCSACGMKAVAQIEQIKAEQAAAQELSVEEAQAGASISGYGSGGWSRIRAAGYGPKRLSPKG